MRPTSSASLIECFSPTVPHLSLRTWHSDVQGPVRLRGPGPRSEAGRPLRGKADRYPSPRLPRSRHRSEGESRRSQWSADSIIGTRDRPLDILPGGHAEQPGTASHVRTLGNFRCSFPVAQRSASRKPAHARCSCRARRTGRRRCYECVGWTLWKGQECLGPAISC
jgi:hypothetical protein